jgi:amidase
MTGDQRQASASILDRDTLGAFCRHTHVELAGAPAGPLAGTRFGVKDLYHIAGTRTGFGHPVWLETHGVADHTALAVKRLLDAGASVVGKTQCDELCYSLNGINKHYGTPINVNAPGRIPGGSSSGSAAAVAGGLVDFALGSDTGGSVRVPASYCGILGMRPTFGAVPLDDAVPFAPSYDTAGWFATDPELFRRVGLVLLAAHGTAPEAGELLIATDAFRHADADAAQALRNVTTGVSGLFPSVSEITLVPEGIDAWMNDFRVIQGAEIWTTHRDWIASLSPDFGAGIKERFVWASTITQAAAAEASARRVGIRARLDALLADNRVLAIPTTPGVAPPVDMPVAELERWRNRALGLMCIGGHAGLPQVNLPLGQVGGLPVGLSLLAARGNDTMLLDLACKLHQHTR